jgi:transposase-like protein
MGKTRRKFSREFKISFLRGLEKGTSVAKGTRRAEIRLCLLTCWKKEFSEDPGILRLNIAQLSISKERQI